MKYLLTIITILCFSYSISAQSGFSFQSVIRDAEGTPQTNTTIYLKFSVLDQSTSGVILYSETQEPETDDYGYISVAIGEGTTISGDYTTINWSDGEKYLIVDCSDDNGSSYSEISSTLINSAPFVGPRGAKGDTGPAGQNGTGVKIVGSVAAEVDLPSSYTGDIGDMYIITSDGSGHVWDGAGWVNVGQIQGPKGEDGTDGGQGPKGDKGNKGDTGPAGTYTAGAGISISGNTISADDNSATNEIQTLQFTGTSLTLSNGGGTIDLGSLSSGISLPYYDEGAQERALFHVHNGYDKKHYGIAGTIGNDNDIPEGPGAGVIGVGNIGVYGLSEGNYGSGILGETSGDEGYGIHGRTDGDGIGGYFETSNTGRAALATGTGNVGIGTKIPKSKLEISDDTKTRLTLNGEESEGVSSLAFKQFQGIDSYQGWLWESDISELTSPKLSLYEYDYLIGTPNNENKKELYSINRETRFGHKYYTHKFSGKAEFDNILKIKGGSDEYTLLAMVPEVVDSVEKKFELYTSHSANDDKTELTLDYLNFDTKTGASMYTIVQNMYKATHYSDGSQRHEFGDALYIRENTSGSSSLNLLVPAANADHYIYHTAGETDGNITYDMGETIIGTNGGAASGNPLYTATSNPILSPSGLGGSHWFYGHIQTDGFSITPAPYTYTHDWGAKIYINSPEDDNQSAIHIDAEHATIPAIEVHNSAGGASISASGPIHINLNGATTKKHQFIMQQKAGVLGAPAYGMLLQNGSSPYNNWELYVKNGGDMNLFYNGVSKGTFNASSGNYSSVSDARLKTNITSLTSILPSLLRLSPKTYNYRSDLSQSFNGFLAQDIQALFPEVVTEVSSRESGESTLMVDYSQLSVLAIKAIQEQQEMITKLNNKIELQNVEHQKIKTRLEALEQLISK